MSEDLKLERSGALYRISPWVPELEAHLSYTKKTFDMTGGGGRSARPTFTVERLCEKLPDGTGIFPAGMFSRVVSVLERMGRTFEVEDHRDIGRLIPEPVFTEVEALRPGQAKVLLAVAANDGGLLVAGTGAGKSFIIRQICRMYPMLKIVIVSPRKAVVETLYDSIRASLGPEVVGKIGGGAMCTGKRVTVVTAKSILKAPIKECDLLLFDEVHGVGANLIATHLAYVTRARKFGFTATPDGRGDGADMVMEALFGPVLVDIDYDEAVSKGLVTPIEVWRYSVPCARPFNDKAAMVTRKRWGYWRNDDRNRAIAAVAREFKSEEQVLIMVETLEHAIYLHKLLPEFKVVHGSATNSKKFIAGVPTSRYKADDKYTRWARRAFEKGELKKVIATSIWKEGVSFDDLAVLIRADGMTSAIASNQIPGRLSRLADGKQKGILVDFGDEFSEWARRRSQTRFKIYKETGWRVVPKILS